MEQITFTLPQLAENDMSAKQQFTLLVNQAAAAIVANYLEHATEVHGQLLDAGVGWQTSTLSLLRFSQTELLELIEGVQDALSVKFSPAAIEPYQP
jgi:hypothetical protein